MPGTLKNYYEILGVPRSATTDEIRTAYRKLLLKFHPDKNIGDSYFEDWSKKINEAFEVLMNPVVRSEYDQVYDETKAAWKQATVINKDVSDDDVPSGNINRPPSVDVAIQKLAPVYISAKQAYIKAERNVLAIEERLKLRPVNATGHFILGSILLVAVLMWMGFTHKDLLSISSAPASSSVERATILPLPLPQKHEHPPLPPEDKKVAEPVDLQLKVIADKAYFFEQPDGKVLEAKFLSKGNKVHAIKKAGNYFFGIFQSAVNTSYKIEGWIKMEDVEIVAQ